MTTSSLCGKPDDYESRKSWTNKDWYTHVGAWENEHGQLCFGSTIAFCAMMQQFHRTHAGCSHTPELLAALEPFVKFSSSLEVIRIEVKTADIERARAAIAKATGEA